MDGRTVRGKALGTIGDTLRFLAVHPQRGPVLVPFAEAEPLSLLEVLRSCTPEDDGPGHVRLAEMCAARGLVEEALRELDDAAESAPGMGAEIRRRRGLLVEEAARRVLEDAREHLAARRADHARAALEDLLRRFPSSPAAREARALRRGLAASSSP